MLQALSWKLASGMWESGRESVEERGRRVIFSVGDVGVIGEGFVGEDEVVSSGISRLLCSILAPGPV